MRKLVILSGKGGTGKTTIVGALAALWRTVIMVDCDVDASNLHLITNPITVEEHSFVATRKAHIDNTLCTDCGICADYCRFDAIHYDPDLAASGGVSYRLDQLSCEGCGLCVHLCPVAAIELQMEKTGEWYLSRTSFGPLVHGRLLPAQGNSGQLVTLLRERANEIPDRGRFAVTLMDGPPGIGCQTIASLTGTDFALLVTEPSKSAFHDLQRVVDLTRHFGIPSGICINKCDLNEDLSAGIEDYANSQGLKVLGRLTYDRSVSQAQVGRQTIVEFANSKLLQQVRSLHESLTDALSSLDAERRIEAG
ncbi:MAG: ATP-binding protein [bacterium]